MNIIVKKCNIIWITSHKKSKPKTPLYYNILAFSMNIFEVHAKNPPILKF
jgi:hypothetical protein